MEKRKRKPRAFRLVCQFHGEARVVDPLDVVVPRLFRGGDAESEVLCAAVIAAADARLRAPGPLAWSDRNEEALQLALEHGDPPPSLEPPGEDNGGSGVLAERWGRRLATVMNDALHPYAPTAPLWAVEGRQLLYRTHPFAMGWTQALCRFFEAFRRIAVRYRSARQVVQKERVGKEAAQLLELWTRGKGTACPALSRLLCMPPLLSRTWAPMLPASIEQLRVFAACTSLEWVVLLAQMAGDHRAAHRWARDLAAAQEVTSYRTVPTPKALFRAFLRAEQVEIGDELASELADVLRALSSPPKLPG